MTFESDNFLTDAHLDSLKHLAEQDIIDNPWPEMANPPSPEETIALVTEIRRLRWTVAMYESALIDKFGPNILDRFGDPPDGWMIALKGRSDG